jgi:hypothetical protein
MKRISCINPPAGVGRDRAERHYMTVHHPFSRRLLRDHAPRIQRYAVNRADQQYSLSGLFDEEPTAWRFVILEVDDDPVDAVGHLPPWVQPLIWGDHAKCAERMSAWEVEAETMVDHRGGQMSSAKFLFLIGAGDSDEETDRRRRYYLGDFRPALTELVARAFGSRLYISNVVQRQAETSDEHGPGASYTGGYLDRSDLVAIDELWFDNTEWGSDMFHSEQAVALFRDSSLGRLEGYAVQEILGLDRATTRLSRDDGRS